MRSYLLEYICNIYTGYFFDNEMWEFPQTNKCTHNKKHDYRMSHKEWLPNSGKNKSFFCIFHLFCGTVVCIRDQTLIVAYQVNPNFFACPGGPLKCCYPLGRLAPNSSWLEVFKKVEHVLVSQETPKLQAVKLFSFFINYIFLFIYH